MASSVAAPTNVVAGHPRAKWTRVAALGFTLVSAGMALWIVGGLIAGQSLGGDMAFLFVGVVGGLLAAGAVWKLGTAGKAVGIVLGLLMLGAQFWVAFSLGAPAAFVEFSGAVMFVLGAFTGIGYSIGGIVRRNEVHAEATTGETRAMRVMLGIVAVAMVVSAVLNFTGRNTVDAAAAAGATQVTITNFEFSPGTYEATAGQATSLLVTNSDAFNHDFTIPALDIETGLIGPGSQQLVEVNAPAGEYTIYCTLHSSTDETDPEKAGMAALLTVK